MVSKSELLEAGISEDCAIFELVGMLSDRIEDASVGVEGPSAVEDGWPSECGPEAPRVEEVEDSLSMISDVVDVPATELVPEYEGPK